MNDDQDLESRLRAGAQAFPPAPAPDRAHLRHVLTTSRRRNRRTQGGVVLCATAAVAGGAVLALREPRRTETLEVAAPDETAASTTEATASATTTLTTLSEADAQSLSEYLNALCQPNFLLDHATLLPHDGDTIAQAHMFQAMTRDGGPFPVDFTVAVDGSVIYSADPDHRYEPPVPGDESSAIEVPPAPEGPGVGRLTLIRMPFDPSAHEITITAGGQSVVLDDPVDGLAPVVDLGAVEVRFGQFDRLCAQQLPATNPTIVELPPATELSPTTVEMPPTTELSPTTVELPPASELSPTTVEWPPTTAPTTTEP